MTGFARPERILRRLFAGGFAASVALAAALALARGESVLLAGLLLGAAAGFLLSRLRGAALPVEWLICLSVLNLLVVVPELALRLAGVRHEPGIQITASTGVAFESHHWDPELFWKNPTDRPGINSMGFRGREVEVPKPPGVYRILFLGDSCTELPQPNYPMAAERRLNARSSPSGPRYEAVVLAVAGYTSHQGRILARKYAPRLEADVAFVYYGWNDHWQAFGAIDAEKQAPSAAASWALRSIRILQVARWLGARRTATGHRLDRLRVPPEQFRENLLAMERSFRERGAPTVFVTAPTTWYRSGVARETLERGLVPDAETAVARHRAYARIVREVAGATGSRLLDLEADWQQIGNLEELMLKDAIHLTPLGVEHAAGQVARLVRGIVAGQPPGG